MHTSSKNKNKSDEIMRYRIKRIGKKYYPQVFVGKSFLGLWMNLYSRGINQPISHEFSPYYDSEAGALKHIEKHKAMNPYDNDIEIIEVEN